MSMCLSSERASGVLSRTKNGSRTDGFMVGSTAQVRVCAGQFVPSDAGGHIVSSQALAFNLVPLRRRSDQGG